MCVSPKTIKKGTQVITVPCGHCFQCIRRRKLDWEIRISSEMSVSSCSYFSLISYNEANYPDPDIADKEAIQHLIRRLRRFLEHHYGKDVKLKYFIVSEYGEERNRLHYHAIFFLYGIFIDRYQWKVLLENEWGKGFCSAYELASNWIHYAVKYMQKSYNMMLASRLGYDAYDKAHQEFRKGISKDIIDPMPDDYPKYYIKGKGHSLPRSWYEKKFENYNAVSTAKRAKALNSSLVKPIETIYKEEMANAQFLSRNPDCAEVEKPYYDARKGLEQSKDFD